MAFRFANMKVVQNRCAGAFSVQYFYSSSLTPSFRAILLRTCIVPEYRSCPEVCILSSEMRESPQGTGGKMLSVKIGRPGMYGTTWCIMAAFFWLSFVQIFVQNDSKKCEALGDECLHGVALRS